MAKTKVLVKNVQLDEWIRANWNEIAELLEEIGEELMEEFDGDLEPNYFVERGEDRKDRPTVNLIAMEEAGWREHYKGGPLTNIAAARKRIKGALPTEIGYW